MSEKTPPPRALVVLGIVAGVLGAVAVVLVVVAVLQRMPSGGTAAPAPAPSVSASASIRPSASASAPSEAATPDTLTLTAEGFSLTDAAGKDVFTFGWRDPAAPAVEALTAAFGSSPTQRVQAGDGSHFPDYTVYQWSGFALFDMVPTPGGASREEFSQPTYVMVSADAAGDIALVPPLGLRIGMPVDEVRALGPSDEFERDANRTRFTFEVPAGGTGLRYSTFADVTAGAVSAILLLPMSQL